MTKLEEVARAIAPEAFAEFPSERLAIAWREKAIEKVRAAILALREPTEEMLHAARRATVNSTALVVSDFMEPIDRDDCELLGLIYPDNPYDRHVILNEEGQEVVLQAAWQAMIDAILGEAK